MILQANQSKDEQYELARKAVEIGDEWGNAQKVFDAITDKKRQRQQALEEEARRAELRRQDAERRKQEGLERQQKAEESRIEQEEKKKADDAKRRSIGIISFIIATAILVTTYIMIVFLSGQDYGRRNIRVSIMSAGAVAIGATIYVLIADNAWLRIPMGTLLFWAILILFAVAFILELMNA